MLSYCNLEQLQLWEIISLKKEKNQINNRIRLLEREDKTGFRSTNRTGKNLPLNCTRMMTIDLSEYYSQRCVDGLDFKTNSGVTMEGLWPEGLTQQLSDPWLRHQ